MVGLIVPLALLCLLLCPSSLSVVIFPITEFIIASYIQFDL